MKEDANWRKPTIILSGAEVTCHVYVYHEHKVNTNIILYSCNVYVYCKHKVNINIILSGDQVLAMCMCITNIK